MPRPTIWRTPLSLGLYRVNNLTNSLYLGHTICRCFAGKMPSKDCNHTFITFELHGCKWPKSQIFIRVSHTNIEHSYWELHYIRGKRHTQKAKQNQNQKLSSIRFSHLWTYFFKWERERESLIIPLRICFGLGVGYFLTKGCCCGVPSICERCLVRGGESFRELDFIWDVLSLSSVGLTKLWWNAPQWMTPCLSEKPMVCEAQCLMIFFFFLLSTWSTLLLGNVSAILLLWCCNFRGCQKCWLKMKPFVNLLPFPFGQFVYGHIQYFSWVHVCEHFLFKKNKIHREYPIFLCKIVLHYHVKIDILYSTRKKKVKKINYKHANS